jgi:hypothetical protein
MRERPDEGPGRVRFPYGDPHPVPILAHPHFSRAVVSGLSFKVPHLRNQRVRTPHHRATGGFPERFLPA